MVRPASSAACTTWRAVRVSRRPPKLLQPSPSDEILKSVVSSVRSRMRVLTQQPHCLFYEGVRVRVDGALLAHCLCSLHMSAVIFSASMMAGILLVPLGSVGMVHASTS